MSRSHARLGVRDLPPELEHPSIPGRLNGDELRLRRRRFLKSGLRRNLRAAIDAGYIALCTACGSWSIEVGGSAILVIDHIVALVAGGTNDAANLQVLCEPCNLRKGAWG